MNRTIARPLTILLACSIITAGTGVDARPDQQTNSQKPAAPAAAGATSAADEALARGKALLRRGQAAEALVQLETARKLFSQADKKRGEAAAHDLLGELYERQGRADLALGHFRDAHQLFTAAATEFSASNLIASAMLPSFDAYRANLTLSKIGNMHFRQGNVDEARAAFAQMNVTKPDTSSLGKIKKGGGMFGKLTNMAAGGMSAVMGAGSLAKERVEAYQQTIVYSAHEMGLGRADYAGGDFDAAKKHFENALAAAKGDLPFVGKLGQTQRYRTVARTSLGDIALQQQRYPDAIKLYTDAAKGARDDKRLDLTWPAERGLGRSRWLLAAQEKDAKKAAKLREESLAAYRQALKTIETLRHGSLRADEARTTFLASTEEVFDEASGALAEMALMAGAPAVPAATPAAATTAAPLLDGPALAFASEAFQIVEQGRARSLLDLLSETNANITEGVPAELLKRKRENQEQQEEIAAQLTGATITGEAPAKPLDELEQELNRLQDQYDGIENEIRTASPRYAALTAAAPLSLAQVQQQVLDDRTVLLEYSLGEAQSYLWAVTKNGVSLHRLPARAVLEKQSAELRDQIIPAKLRRAIINTSAAEQQRGLTLDAANAGSSSSSGGAPAAAFAASAHALYQTAVAPAAAAAADEKRLLIVADGALNYVPFEALVTAAPGEGAADYAALPYLIKTNEIVYAPSASVLAGVRQQQQQQQQQQQGARARALLLIADPVFDESDPRARAAQQQQQVGGATTAMTATSPIAPQQQGAKSGGERGLTLSSALSDLAAAAPPAAAAEPKAGRVKLARLVGTRVEAEQIAQMGKASGYKTDVWLDLEARENNIEARDLKAYRVMHLATHGLLNTERPQFTGIVLSLVGNSTNDGFLRTDEIFNLRLGAPLVMLSACETGLGKEKRGEGVIGLARAFIYAGAPAVGVSLWSVADRSTAELMTSFYKQLLSTQEASPTAALRAAQVAMISGKKYSAPFYWAPFVMIGDWRF